MSSPPRRRRRLNADDSPDSNANGTALEGADALLDTEETGSLRESGGTGAGNDAETRSVSDDEEDDGDASDPPPMEYDADRDREIDEDPDNSDGGGGDPDEEEGEDIMDMDKMDADYVAIPELDKYDDAELDRREYGTMDYSERRAAEQELAERDRARGGRLAGILDEFGSEDEADRGRRRAQLGLREAAGGTGEEEAGDDQDEDDEDQGEMNLEDFQGVPLREWIAQDATRREIKRRFQSFLLTFQDKSNRVPVHETKIKSMCAANRASLEVSYIDLSKAVPILAIWLADVPKDMLEIMDEVTNTVVLKAFPEYHRIHDEVHVHITHVPIVDKLRDLREVHLHALIKVHGVVTRRSGVFPQLKLVKYRCHRCQTMLGPFRVSGSGVEAKPGSCPGCQAEDSFRIDQEQTMYRNYQKITLQESPGSVPPGRVPRYKDVILLADLIDRARPGEEIEVTGIYSHSYDLGLSQKSGFPVFGTLIEANYIQKRQDQFSVHRLTDDDRREILALGRDPQIGRRIISSIAPSIYGHQHVKTAIALSLFGGCAKDVNAKHRIRGDINVLLLGDPGTAKSQVLKYCEKTAPRAVYTTGKGASAVGLTAGVHKDPLTKEWTLEGGALVLADRGMCLIDEFDKMNEQDRTSIHEAMEQQSISVSKAGIVTSLQARCAVVAAANPIGGRYDASLTLAENVELTDPILQRFDCLCVLQDMVDPVMDEQLAMFVVESHRRSHPLHGKSASNVATDRQDEVEGSKTAIINDKARKGASSLELRTGEGTIPQHLLRKYIMYARNNVRPQLHNIDQDKVARLYADLRRESSASGGVPIAVRHIESVMRMAEARARMHLREGVREDDVDVAIATILESFIQAQKVSVRRALRRGFRKYLADPSDFFALLLVELQKMFRDEQTYYRLRHSNPPESLEVEMDELESKAGEFGIYDLSGFYTSRLFKEKRFSVDKPRRKIIKTF
ncbi:unnamed protein product [Ascophyllum nodosum]